MLLKRTISQLDIGYVPAQHAQKMGHLGYVQWLGALKGHQSYRDAALHAYRSAQPFAAGSPAIAVFCELLLLSIETPLAQLDLKLPVPARRGGAKARRAA
ncbi:MAG: hypothetical protein AAF647_07050, partial [Pseudomonadota bacterium]